MKQFSILSILFLFVTAAFSRRASDATDTLRLKYGIPELAFAVVKADTVPEMQVSGYRRADSTDERGRAATNDYFHLGSNTKAITAFVAAYLVEQGKIKWTAKFFDLFPEWKKSSHKAYHGITLQDLLSHRARVRAYTKGPEYAGLPEFKGTVPEKRKAFAKHVLSESPVTAPKDIPYAYSNAGYSIAVQMLEKVTGKTWEELVKEILGEKLGIAVAFGWPNRKSPDQPWGHWVENKELKPLPPDHFYDLRFVEPAGDISIALPDYAKFIALNLQGLAGRDNILKAETYRFLHHGLEIYSLGWTNFIKDDRRMSDHAGSAGTFFCYTLVDDTKGTAYVIMANSATAKTQEGIFTLLETLMAKYSR